VNDQILIRILAGIASPDEVEAADRWRRGSPENEEYFQETLRVWTATTPETRGTSAVSGRARSIIEEADRRRAVSHARTGERHRRSPR